MCTNEEASQNGVFWGDTIKRREAIQGYSVTYNFYCVNIGLYNEAARKKVPPRPLEPDPQNDDPPHPLHHCLDIQEAGMKLPAIKKPFATLTEEAIQFDKEGTELSRILKAKAEHAPEPVTLDVVRRLEEMGQAFEAWGDGLEAKIRQSGDSYAQRVVNMALVKRGRRVGLEAIQDTAGLCKERQH